SLLCCVFFFFFSSRRRHTRSTRDWSSDVCSSDLRGGACRSTSMGGCSRLRADSAAMRGLAPGGVPSAASRARARRARRASHSRRSEERRVGKEGRAGGARGQEREKQKGTERRIRR